MSEHLEIEFKTLVSEEAFFRLLTYFQLTTNDFFTQVNTYYDSNDFQLKARQMGLRIRTLANTAELTLKVPASEGLLEINDTLSLAEAQQLIATNCLPKQGAVYDKLSSLGIQSDILSPIGSLKTRRAEKELSIGLLALDESWYNQQHDFELELEVTDAKLGQQQFVELLADLGIPYAPAPNKVRRMMQTRN